MSRSSESWILSDPSLLGGKPHIRGTEVTVAMVLELMLAGHTVDEVLSEEPLLTREAVEEAIRYSSRLAH